MLVEMICDDSPQETPSFKRSCVDCHTTRTPMWRGGPAGPGSLCNACGIRYRKKRKALLGSDEGERAKRMKKKRRSNNGGVRKEILLQRCYGSGKAREEEEAAMLLMALSAGGF